MPIKYRTDQTPHIKFCSPAGHNTYYDYKRGKDKNGVPTLIRGCAHDIDEELAAAARGCDLESIIRRAALGDPNAIMPVTDDMFGDATQMPTSLADAELQLMRARETFYQLPVELRNRYNNNPTKFMQALADGSYLKSIADRVNAGQTTSGLTDEELASIRTLLSGGNNNA